jgi:hypothetical protein
MAADTQSLAAEVAEHPQWYEIETEIRGCELSLQDIKAAYRELQSISDKEGARLISQLIKPDDTPEDEWQAQIKVDRESAFRLTISIIGEDGSTFYGETAETFESKNLPSPIKGIYFTNINSFRRRTNGSVPRNRFELWFDFEKRPLLDTNPLISDPTPNASKIKITSEEIMFFRAVQNVIRERINNKQKWYSFIHKKLIYDLLLFLIGLPYVMYLATSTGELIASKYSKFQPFKLASFIYFTLLFLVIFRYFTSYVKWVFPVNILTENKDIPTKHRIFVMALISGLLISIIRAVGNLATSPLAN